MYAKFEKNSVNKYSSYRSEMVSTDGWTDGRTDTERYNIIPRHTLVAGYKKTKYEWCSGIYLIALSIDILEKYTICHSKNYFLL